MSDPASPLPTPPNTVFLARGPIRNLRVTFWGVQGSCPIFPSPKGLSEYARRLAVFTLARAFDEMQRLARNTADGRIDPRELIGGSPTSANVEGLQRRLGLPELPAYGGETTCIEVETSEGNKLIFDAGSGIRRCSMEILSQWKDRPSRTLHLFGSHEHLDHRMGLTFSRFCYAADNPFTIHVYGGFQFLHALDQHYGLFSHQTTPSTYIDDPVDYTIMPAKFIGSEIRPAAQMSEPRPRHWSLREVGKPIQIGRTTVTPFEVYHVIPLCLGYKVEHDGASFVFVTDHELRRGTDPGDERQRRSDAAEATVTRHCQGADAVYIDGQYFLEEYLGRKGIGSSPPLPRLDWGHSCVEDAVERAFKCNIRRTYIGHHDPERTWADRVEMDKHLARLCLGKPNQVLLADSDFVIDL
jgi:phosphoribosyl 1,2-cyclic phosphodiesterase